jgi:hypothetical protein
MISVTPRLFLCFFGVEPNDLRHIESGVYAETFEKHQRKGRVPMEVIEKWKKALEQASLISGLLFNHGLLFKTDERAAFGRRDEDKGQNKQQHYT